MVENLEEAEADRGDRGLRGVGRAEPGVVGESFRFGERGKGINRIGETVADDRLGERQGFLNLRE